MLREGLDVPAPGSASSRPTPRLLVSGIRRDQLSAFPSNNVRRLIDRAQALTGISTFEPSAYTACGGGDRLNAGKASGVSLGELTPALLASTAIPGVFPDVRINGREHLDGGVVEKHATEHRDRRRPKEILAISLMAGGEREQPPRLWRADSPAPPAVPASPDA